MQVTVQMISAVAHLVVAKHKERYIKNSGINVNIESVKELRTIFPIELKDAMTIIRAITHTPIPLHEACMKALINS